MIVTTPDQRPRGSGARAAPRRVGGPPRRAKLLESSDIWKEDTTSWSMEVVVRTARGETYKNSVVWK